MYNENDLKTIWFAYKGGMKKHQVAQLMDKTEDEIVKMLDAAQKLFGGQRREKDVPVQIDKRPYFRRPIITEKINQPFTRPAAKYDNKSSEERINDLLAT